MKNLKKIIAVFFAAVMMMSGLSVMGFAAGGKKIDLVFVIDTTGSMGDDINYVKRDVNQIVGDIVEQGQDYRLAVIDYRDFPERTGDDYVYNIQLDFTSDDEGFLSVVDGLNVDGGGDTPEAVYSALIDGVSSLSWRSGAGKAVILMGDAPALDPEPYTGYTADDALAYLNSGRRELVEKKYGSSPDSVEPQAVSKSAITLFAINTGSSTSTTDCFEYLANGTNGKYYETSSDVSSSEIILKIIEEIPDVVEEPNPSFWDRIKEFFRKLWYLLTLRWDEI